MDTESMIKTLQKNIDNIETRLMNEMDSPDRNFATGEFMIDVYREISAKLEQLKEYDDLGLTVANIKEIDRMYSEQSKELMEYRKAEEEGLLLRLPCGVGDTVYVLCECEKIPEQLDGTLYDKNGGLGTATGYYCPYENDCPHADSDYSDDCCKCKDKTAVFEDTVVSVHLDEGGVYITTNNCSVTGDLGDFIFLTKSEAESKLKELEGE